MRAIHWWGRTADKLVLARPAWFQVAIWLEVFVQAPFYVLAILAFLRQQSWIRVPAIIYSTVLLTIMCLVLSEQYSGAHKTDKPWLVTAVYGAYVVMPIVVLARVRHAEVFLARVRGKAGAARKSSSAADSDEAKAAAPPPSRRRRRRAVRQSHRRSSRQSHRPHGRGRAHLK